ncbi:MAG: isochorismatase [Deltaproteobacteria bacterium]
MTHQELPIAPHYNPDKVGEIWRVPYQQRAEEAEEWAKQRHIPPAASDRFRICLLPVDVQNTFCIPGFELYVGGRSGTGSVDDNRRLGAFIYRNLRVITEICPTLDTHQAMQIFHGIFLVNDKGEHPAPYTLISEDDITREAWRFNPSIAKSLGITESYGQRYLQHYARRLKESGRYDLTVWPYHAMLGGIGYALVSSVEEAIFFHSIARYSQTHFEIKGNNPLIENYSVLGPEVLEDGEGRPIARKNTLLIQKLLQFDMVIIAGQAKSHCVAWTIDDLLRDILVRDKRLAEKVYLLEDCTSPVVVPGIIDYTDAANAAFRRFAEAGMHVVRSTDPMETWPGMG